MNPETAITSGGVLIIAGAVHPNIAPTSAGALNVYSTGYVTTTLVVTLDGVVTDGSSNNFTVINAALASLSGGGVTVVLPPGKIAIGSTLQIPTGVILAGAGAVDRGSAGSQLGTTILPTSGFSSSLSTTCLVELNGQYAGLRDLVIDVGASGVAASALCVDSDDCQAINCSFLGGAPSSGTATTYTVDSSQNTGSSARFNMLNCWLDNSAAVRATIPGVLRAEGLDWIVTGCEIRNGTKSLRGGGAIWANIRFLSGTPNVSLGNVSNAEQVLTSCFFDSSTGTALIVHSSGSGQCLFSGCRFYQGSAPTGGVPLILEQDTTPASSVTLSGCVVASGAQAFTYLVQGATNFTQVSDISMDAGTVQEITAGTVFSGLPGHASNVFMAGAALNQVETSTAAGTATLYLMSVDNGVVVPTGTVEGASQITYVLVLNGYKTTTPKTLTFPHAYTLDTPIVSASNTITSNSISITCSTTQVTIGSTAGVPRNGYVLIQGS